MTPPVTMLVVTAACACASSSAFQIPTSPLPRLATPVRQRSARQLHTTLVRMAVDDVAPVAPGRLNEWGAAAKARYRKRKAAVSSSSLLLKPVQFTIASFYLMLFIWYRAYRGFFVIVPEVFRAVQDKLRKGVTEAETELNADVNPETGKLRRRSEVVIGIGALVVTFMLTAMTVVKGTLSGIRMMTRSKEAREAMQSEMDLAPKDVKDVKAEGGKGL